jgi:hypothetical protein
MHILLLQRTDGVVISLDCNGCRKSLNLILEKRLEIDSVF